MHLKFSERFFLRIVLYNFKGSYFVFHSENKKAFSRNPVFLAHMKMYYPIKDVYFL